MKFQTTVDRPDFVFYNFKHPDSGKQALPSSGLGVKEVVALWSHECPTPRRATHG